MKQEWKYLVYALLSVLAAWLVMSVSTCMGQDVVSRRSTGAVSYTTIYDTIDANNRDGYSAGGNEALGYDASRIFVGKLSTDKEYGGFEFQLAVAQGKTIDSCYIFIYKTGDDYGFSTSDTLQWQAYNVDNASVFDDAHSHDLNAHAALVSDSVAVTESAPSAAGWMKSPNLASLLQTVVNRAGWASGQYAGFILGPKTVATDHDFGLTDFGAGSNIAYIKVVYH